MLPFGNIVVTATVNGAKLKTMLENGVSSMPAANGRFAQVSGLCFTYNIEAAVGSRVTGAVRQAADGTCTGARRRPDGAGRRTGSSRTTSWRPAATATRISSGS